MPRKFTALSFILALSLMTFFVVSSSGARALDNQPMLDQTPSAPAPKCSDMSDKQIRNAIVKKIKADADLTSEWKGVPKKNQHLSISVKNRVVTIVGFVSGEARKNKVIEIAKQTGCSVVSDKFCPAPCGNCDPPTKKCGSLCIGPDDSCSLVR